jgi:hypothetical protein
VEYSLSHHGFEAFSQDVAKGSSKNLQQLYLEHQKEVEGIARISLIPLIFA